MQALGEDYLAFLVLPAMLDFYVVNGPQESPSTLSILEVIVSALWFPSPPPDSATEPSLMKILNFASSGDTAVADTYTNLLTNALSLAGMGKESGRGSEMLKENESYK